jgi:hypothetical protein
MGNALAVGRLFRWRGERAGIGCCDRYGGITLDLRAAPVAVIFPDIG